MSDNTPWMKRTRLAFAGAALSAAAGWWAGSRAQDAPPRPAGAEAAFLRENDEAMAKMMADMAVQPTGDVDRDFVLMMVPHHQGAIDMSVAVLRHGRNEQVRRLAQEIIVTQQQEIVAMRRAVGLPPVAMTPPAATQPSTPSAAAAHNATHHARDRR